MTAKNQSAIGYEFVLKVGHATADQIAKKTKLNRNNVAAKLACHLAAGRLEKRRTRNEKGHLVDEYIPGPKAVPLDADTAQEESGVTIADRACRFIEKKGRARSDEIAAALEIPVKNLSAILAARVKSGALFSCMVTYPNGRTGHQYGIGSGMPDTFQPLQTGRKLGANAQSRPAPARSEDRPAEKAESTPAAQPETQAPANEESVEVVGAASAANIPAQPEEAVATNPDEWLPVDPEQIPPEHVWRGNNPMLVHQGEKTPDIAFLFSDRCELFIDTGDDVLRLDRRQTERLSDFLSGIDMTLMSETA